MDRVTRYPIFSNPHSARVTGLALDGDSSYTIELVGVGPEATWSQDDPQVWATDHEARPYMKNSGVSYARQSFPSQLSLGSSYLEDDDEEMKAYHLDIYDGLHQPQDLERERWAIIHGQAVRKGGTVVATLGGAPDREDTGHSSQRQSTLMEESMVDREQIDFLAARQQFLSLEQANVDALPPHPTTRATLTHTPIGVRQSLKTSNGPHGASTPLGVSQISKASNRPHGAIAAVGIKQIPKASNGPHVANGYVVPFMSQEKKVVLEEKGVHGFPSGSSIGSLDGPGSPSQADPSELPKETPIEREIRLAQEREADLREQRGLRRAAGQQELVQIPSRPLLNKVTLTEVPRRDRGRPSLYVQRDMVQETQREEDHRREGLQVGRASTPDWASEDPQLGLRISPSSDCILSPTPDARAADQAPEIRKVNRIPLDAYQPYLGPGIPQREFSPFGVYSKSSGVATEDTKAMALPKVTGSSRHLSESSGKLLHTSSKPPRGHPRATGGVVRWEYFRLRPLRFRVLDGPQQVENPSHTWGWEVAGAPALRLQRSQSSDLLEREVENVLRREREVAEERRNALFPEVFSPTPDEDWQPDSRSSSRGSGITGSYSVSESPTFTPVHLHSGLVWKAEAPADSNSRQNKKEQWYAGINPADHINSEILGATRVTRHKNAMAERWEARLYASEDED
uniref:mitotic interactor and substrate of PLK1 n=1 Tax=Jaculus jaculus TaxID=51337 RepID=UPI001E1B0BE9|nr:mitotic interactor and substrate of PLK1 [Jaculus jaculus]XP_044990861.1 mitotic interactor and substrate of PLK1 [Jaculus jaculus]XP_044990862.1 mitotic interactor and substrate of PLK1 [Jaculus jaculus]